MKRHNCPLEVATSKNQRNDNDLGTSRHSSDDIDKIRCLLEKWSSLIKTCQRVNLKQVIFDYCLCAEEPFQLETVFEVLRAYEIQVKVIFSFRVDFTNVKRWWDHNLYIYFHSSHNNGVMLDEAFRIASDADVMAFKIFLIQRAIYFLQPTVDLHQKK